MSDLENVEYPLSVRVGRGVEASRNNTSSMNEADGLGVVRAINENRMRQ